MKTPHPCARMMSAVVLGILALPALAGDGPEVARRQRHFSTEGGNHLALQGYDPVSYFEGKPQKGDAARSAVYGGITYRFASPAHLKKFQAQPAAYEPAYGGWCAWAMLEGDRVAVDPETYKIADGRLLLFYNGWLGNTLKKWNAKSLKEGEASLLKTADGAWAKIFK